MRPTTDVILKEQPASDNHTIHSLPLRTNLAWTFVGNTIYTACQWGMLTVLAKLGTPEMVGRFSLGLAVTAPVIMLTNLQLRAIQATDARDEYAFGDYLGLRLIMTTLALLSLAGIALVSGYGAESMGVILIIGWAKAFESISDVIYGLLQKHERMDRIAISLMIKGPLSLLALGLLVWATGSVVYGALGLAVAWLAILLFYDLGNARRLTAIRPQAQKQKLTQLVKLALPLGVVMMLISLNTNLPRYFIQHYQGERELGYFSAMAYLMLAGSMVITALGQSASPRLAKHYADKEPHLFQSLLFKLVVLGMGLALASVWVSVFLGRYILAIVYRPDYAQYATVFIWIMLAAGVSYTASLLGYGMTAARYFRVQVPLFIAVTLSTGVASMLFIPPLGLLGAAYALLAGATINLIGSIIVNIHSQRNLSKLVSRKLPNDE